MTPLGQMMLTWRPWSRKATASPQTRVSSGATSFSMTISTLRGLDMAALFFGLRQRARARRAPDRVLVDRDNLARDDGALQVADIDAPRRRRLVAERSLQSDRQCLGIAAADAAALSAADNLAHIANIGRDDGDVAGHGLLDDIW